MRYSGVFGGMRIGLWIDPALGQMDSVDYEASALMLVSGGGSSFQSLDYQMETHLSENVKGRLQSSTGFELIDFLEPSAYPPGVDLNGKNAGNDCSAEFVYEHGATAIADANSAATDNNSDTIWTLSVAILNLPDGAAEFLGTDTSGTEISCDSDADLGLLTLNGPDTLANCQTALRTVAYNITAAASDFSDCEIGVAADDGTNVGDMALNTPHLANLVDAMQVWVDFANTGAQTGHRLQPFDSLIQAAGAVGDGATISVESGAKLETAKISKPLRLEAVDGTARIGAP